MIVYAESSAVLSWLLGEPEGPAVRRALEGAEFVVTSDLTLIECDRAFHRARSLGEVSVARFAELRGELRHMAEGWVLLQMTDEIVRRAREAFPGDSIRSLDALHLASVLDTVALIPETALLTHDRRVRHCAQALGLRLLPTSSDGA